MTAYPSYSTGTVAIGAGATTVVGTGTIWSGVNVRPGDELVIGGNSITIVDVTDTTHIVIDAWPYSAVTAGTAYKVYQLSPLRFAGGQAMADVSALVAALNTDGFYVFVPSTATVPDPSYGNNGQYAFQAATGKLWIKSAGAWSFLGIYKAFGLAAPWSAATAYNVNDVATLAGSSYVCVLAHTNQTPPNATYWQVLAAKGDTGAIGASGASYAATSTTSFLIGTGSKTFTTQSGLAYVVGTRARAASNANPANYMEGIVTAYSGTTLTVNITRAGGSGTFADWNLSVAGDPGSGDMLTTNNLSDVTNRITALSNLNYLVAATGGIARSATSKLSDLVSVKDFGAKGDGITDDTAAIQAAINAATASGLLVRIPQGAYVVSSTLTVSNSGAGTVGSSQTISSRLGIIGDGAGSSILLWTGGASACLSISTGAESLSRFSGFSVLQPGATKIGTGININQTAHATFDNVSASGFTNGIATQDSFSLAFIRCHVKSNVTGVNATVVSGSRPNDFGFVSCNITDNTTIGAYFQEPATLNFKGGSLERNGSGAGNGALKIDGNPVEGSAGLQLDGVYFELNGGSFDVGIYDSKAGGATGPNGIHSITGCTFSRTTNTAFTSANVALFKSTTAKTIVRVAGNGFLTSGSYVPDPSRAYVQVLSSNGLNYLVDLGANYYTTTTEKPAILGPAASDNRVAAAVRFNGSTGAISGVSTNVASITRNGLGDYTVNYAKPLRDTANVYSIGGTEVPSFWSLFIETTTFLHFKIVNSAGTAVDFNNISVIVFGADGSA